MVEVDFVCISLISRKDRRVLISDLFRQLGIINKINWWIVEKHPRGGMYGCFESHWSVWNAKEFSSPYLCVFEDDLMETPELFWRFYHALELAKRFLPSQLDILNLEPGFGHVEKKLTTPEDPIQIYQGFFLNLGAYIIHRSSIKRISNRVISWFGMDIDTALYKNCRMGAVLPRVLRQRGEDSDNGGGYRELFSHSPPPEKYDGSKDFLRGISLLNLVTLESIQFLSWSYLTLWTPPLEFKDRRVFK